MPVFQLSKEIIFPPPTLARDDGLLAVGGDLSEERLLFAYKMGIFPWYSQGDPILWWAPVPRLIMRPQDFKAGKRLKRYIRNGAFTFSMDRSFPAVIKACAESRVAKGEDTWINQEMISAYCQLHASGYAHSLECWQDEELIGGLYGISIGSVFCGESMFSRASNSSKTAFAILAQTLSTWNFDFIDCQMRTEHLINMGAQEIPGHQFFAWLKKAILKEDRRGTWQLPNDSAYHSNNSNDKILTPGVNTSSLRS